MACRFSWKQCARLHVEPGVVVTSPLVNLKEYNVVAQHMVWRTVTVLSGRPASATPYLGFHMCLITHRQTPHYVWENIQGPQRLQKVIIQNTIIFDVDASTAFHYVQYDSGGGYSSTSTWSCAYIRQHPRHFDVTWLLGRDVVQHVLGMEFKEHWLVMACNAPSLSSLWRSHTSPIRVACTLGDNIRLLSVRNKN